MLDTARYALDAEPGYASAAAQPDTPAASGVAVCYSGLQRGFARADNGALENHLALVLQPLMARHGRMHVFFSVAEGDELPPRAVTMVRAAGVEQVVAQQREAAPAKRHAQPQQRGLRHCGVMISRAEARLRGGAFAFGVRLRYDIAFHPRLRVLAWPVWNRTAPGSAPILALSKHHAWRGRTSAKPCVPQDVFFAVRRDARLGSVSAMFLRAAPSFMKLRLRSLDHPNVPEKYERAVFAHALLSGVPLAVLFQPTAEHADRLWCQVRLPADGPRGTRGTRHLQCSDQRAIILPDAAGATTAGSSSS